MNSWIRHYMVQDKDELIGMMLSRDKAIKQFEKQLNNKDKEIENLHSIIKEVRETLEININEHNYDGASISALEILDKVEENTNEKD